MTLKGEIVKQVQKIVESCLDEYKESGEYTCLKVINGSEEVLSAIKRRVPKEKEIDKFPSGKNIINEGFNTCRNQFLNEVEGI